MDDPTWKQNKYSLVCEKVESRHRALGDSKRAWRLGKTCLQASICEALRNPLSFRKRKYVKLQYIPDFYQKSGICEELLLHSFILLVYSLSGVKSSTSEGMSAAVGKSSMSLPLANSVLLNSVGAAAARAASLAAASDSILVTVTRSICCR